MEAKPLPTGRDAVALQEIGGLIMSRFSDAAIDVVPSSREKGAWLLLVYLTDEDERYEALADLVYGRLAEMRYAEGIKIEMMSFDKDLESSLKTYMQAQHSLRKVADAAMITPVYGTGAQEAGRNQPLRRPDGEQRVHRRKRRPS